jgi:branched-chain amino acid transport system ATP-binding protein
MSAGLCVRDLRAGYEADNPIVRGIDLAVEPGRVLTLIGPNGAGKSTAMKALAGIVPLTSGAITVAGRPIDGLPVHQRVTAGLSFVPQSGNVFASLSIADNLSLGAPAGIQSGRERALALLRSLPELADGHERPAGQLSGGQRQMVAVARALMACPRVLMLDEPTAGLAPQAVDLLLATVRRLADDGLAVLLVEQNVAAALTVSDEVMVLSAGRCALTETPSKLRTDPRLSALYLGGIPT